jgi:crescentin
MLWSSFRNAVGQQVDAARDWKVPPKPSPTVLDTPPTLDAIGQRDELVRQRIAVMLDRLDDFKTLREDFGEIVKPLGDISAELPRAAARIAELETSLAQEMQAVSRTRLENQDISARNASLSHDLSIALSRADRLEMEIRERESVVEQQRIALRDKAVVIENMERQLFAEVEQAKAAFGESKALRAEAQAADAALSRAEHELGTLRERATLIDQDNRRLQTITEEQASVLVELRARLEELENAAETERQQQRILEERLAAETAARVRVESQYEVETGAFRSERSSLMMKLEALTHRSSTAEQILTQTRNQLRERDEASRTAERLLKEAVIARSSVERRLENLQSDVSRQAERFTELQRAKDELTSRCDMLVKAIAAKDVSIGQAADRAESLQARIEQLSARHETERAELDLANRRLTEDLENEKSERALVQGALEIARESRISLQKQYDALKRAGRGLRHSVQEPDPEQEPDSRLPNNVHSIQQGKGA